MKPLHWVVLSSIFVLIISVYLVFFKVAPVATKQIIQVASVFSSNPEPKSPDLESIKQIDPFKTASSSHPKAREMDCTNPQLSLSNYKLISTAVLNDREKSLAVLKSQDGRLISVREGQQIQEEFKVIQIKRFQILIKNLSSNSCEFIDLDGLK